MPTTTRSTTRYTVRKASPKSRATTRAKNVRRTRPKVYSGLPGWKELASDNERKRAARGKVTVERISTARFALMMLVAVVSFTLYVGHVHATQDLLADVQALRRQNLDLHLKYNRVKGEFDRVTGPQVIYERARAIGLEEGFAYGATIHPLDAGR